MTDITSDAELREILGAPLAFAATKDRTVLDEVDRLWLAHSPFCLVATSDANGRLDVSPKGDPPGFIHVLDDTTIAIPERPGNRRADGFHNILSNPHAGLISFLPGRGDTLRINGRARLVRDGKFFDQMTVKGHRPLLALVVEIEKLFYHCSKAFMRSALWDPATWDPTALPSRAELSKRLERTDEPLETLKAYYGTNFSKSLYRSSEEFCRGSVPE